MRSKEEILADIDTTLDQLIHNAEAFKCTPPELLDQSEIEALQKTQTSLLARLIHRDSQLKQNQNSEQIRRKISQFSRLNARLVQDMARRFKKKCKLKPN